MESRLRRGVEADTAALLRICEECFPRSPRWSAGGRFGLRWLRAALRSDCADVYVLECDHRLLGFVVLVLDEVGWRHEKRARCGSTMQYLAAAIQSPLLTVRDVLHRIRLRYGRFSEISPDEERRGARAWIELIAVERANRRMGIANRLQGQCEERTLAMGRPRLELNVDPGNQEMRRFVARRGYEWTGTTRTGCLYSLLLGSDEARTS